MPQLRLLSGSSELIHCEAIQREVWGMADRGIVPMAHLAATVHAGGMVAGVYERNQLAGFVYGFPATHGGKPGTTGLHSHMLAVLPSYRNKGLGKALKWYQRAWCLEKGLSWMTWTYDPLQRKNARLNFEHLGVTASEYLVNAYGDLGDELNIGLPTDRLVALWELSDSRVAQLFEGESLDVVDPSVIPQALSQSQGGRPIIDDLNLSSPQVRIAVPDDINLFMRADPELASEWRFTLRTVLLAYLQRGYEISRFLEGDYILRRNDGHQY